MKRTMYFSSVEEMNEYFPNGVSNNVLAVIQSDPDIPGTLYSSSNNSPVTEGEAQYQGPDYRGGTDPEDKDRITALEEGKADKSDLEGLATESYVQHAIEGIDVDLTGYATEAYVTSSIQNVVGAAPAALDTLKEIGDALNNDADFAGTMTAALANKADKSQLVNLATETFAKRYADDAVDNLKDYVDGNFYDIKDADDTFATKDEIPDVSGLANWNDVWDAQINKAYYTFWCTNGDSVEGFKNIIGEMWEGSNDDSYDAPYIMILNSNMLSTWTETDEYPRGWNNEVEATSDSSLGIYDVPAGQYYIVIAGSPEYMQNIDWPLVAMNAAGDILASTSEDGELKDDYFVKLGGNLGVLLSVEGYAPMDAMWNIPKDLGSLEFSVETEEESGVSHTVCAYQYKEYATTAAVAGKADASSVYTKTQVDTILGDYATEEFATVPIWDEEQQYVRYRQLGATMRLMGAAEMRQNGVDNNGDPVATYFVLNDMATESYVADYVSTYAPSVDLTGYATETYVTNAVAGKADASNVYTKAQIDTQMAAKAENITIAEKISAWQTKWAPVLAQVAAGVYQQMPELGEPMITQPSDWCMQTAVDGGMAISEMMAIYTFWMWAYVNFPENTSIGGINWPSLVTAADIEVGESDKLIPVDNAVVLEPVKGFDLGLIFGRRSDEYRDQIYAWYIAYENNELVVKADNTVFNEIDVRGLGTELYSMITNEEVQMISSIPLMTSNQWHALLDKHQMTTKGQVADYVSTYAPSVDLSDYTTYAYTNANYTTYAYTNANFPTYAYTYANYVSYSYLGDLEQITDYIVGPGSSSAPENLYARIIWTGTAAEYNALTNYSTYQIYLIQNEQE